MSQHNQKVVLKQENQVTSIPYIQLPKDMAYFGTIIRSPLLPTIRWKQIVWRIPIDIMPIYVKAGSILPIAIGPDVQYTEEKKWDDTKKTLTIGSRNGEFPGMLKNRKFKIVLVNKDRGLGDLLTTKVNKNVTYKGKSVRIKL